MAGGMGYGPRMSPIHEKARKAGGPSWLGRGPYDLDDRDAYERWRDGKLACIPASVDGLAVELPSLERPGEAACQAISDRCRRVNMAIYSCRDGGPDDVGDRARPALAAFAAAFGLMRLDRNLCADEDGITALEVRADPGAGAGEYIPYSDRRLSWHTDGYYNEAHEQVRAVILHCARPADDGGENALLDPEIAYIRLRDADPGHIEALMHPGAMTIPANAIGGQEIRPARSGPVFSMDPGDGALHMRYTARAVNIVWRDDPATRAAVAALAALCADGSPDVLRWRLGPGQGYVTNNVLHNRSAFRDNRRPGRGRLIYRARFFDRVAAQVGR